MKPALKRLFQNDFFVALLFLLAYLCTNSYIYAWDDQHLEIPMLKHLIDPSLYKGDYYVESLSRNFSSFLYPILAKAITLKQVPAAYLLLFLLSRYAMFFWVYRLWQWLAGDKWSAAAAVLMFFLMGRTEEFLYRTFSHQEFCYIFMLGGFYYFYRERFLLAALLFGVGANFNAIYNLFPMVYMLVFILLFSKDRFQVAFKSGAVFMLAAMPFLMWQIPHSLARAGRSAVPASEWMPLYLITCQQNFLFWTSTLNEALRNVPFMLERLEPYLYLLALYVFLCFVEPRLRADRKTHVLVVTAYVFIVLSFIFSYLYPSRFIIDLNFLRNEQFARFMLMGYATLFACRQIKEGKGWTVLAAALFFLLFGQFGQILSLIAHHLPDIAHGKKEFLPLFAVLRQYAYVPMVCLGLFIWLLYKPRLAWLRSALIIFPLLVAFVSYSQFHYQYLQEKAHGAGFWQMYRAWVDIQNYVRTHTPKDTLILIPHNTDTGGFRIFSERKVLVCYRDCGIIGFDYNAAVEWNKRIKDIQEFKYMATENPQRAVFNAVMKYKVDYIVFMNYYQPQGDNPVLQKIYQNEVLALYKVNK